MRLLSHRVGSPWAVVALCSVLLVAEGYDLIVYGALLPSLLREPGWGLTGAAAGTIGSMAYVGMSIGAVAGGRLTDRFGRRWFVVGSVAWFTLWTAAGALSGGPWQLGLFRLLAGIGMGGVMPAAFALATEYAPRGRTALAITVMTTGLPVGGTLASLLALGVLETHGWRAMFWIGAAASVVILAVAAVWLPESKSFVRARAERTRFGELFGPRLRVTSILFALTSFVSLLTWYGMNTWVATVMRALNYPLSSALTFSLVMNAGAVAGSFAFAAAADRWGSRRTGVVCALFAAAGITGYVLGTTVLAVLLIMIALFGMGANSALNLINASIAATYPTTLRGTALGWSNGIGRLGAVAAPTVGGWVLAGLGPRAVFGTFLITALCAAALFVALALTARASLSTWSSGAGHALGAEAGT
jgi:AAHS family benzoate transporter-like MFS transporter